MPDAQWYPSNLFDKKCGRNHSFFLIEKCLYLLISFLYARNAQVTFEETPQVKINSLNKQNY